MENGCCASEVATGYAEGVEDVVIWWAGSEVEGLVAEGGKDSVDIFCESYKGELEESFGL
jgi:hypothetical protein